MQTMTTATETIIDTLRGLDYDPTSITSPAGDVTFIDADSATTYRLGLEFDGFALSLNGMPLVSGVNGESAFCSPRRGRACGRFRPVGSLTWHPTSTRRWRASRAGSARSTRSVWPRHR